MQELPEKLIELFGSKEKAIQAANMALMYIEYIPEEREWYWYESQEEKIKIFYKWIQETYKPLKIPQI